MTNIFLGFKNMDHQLSNALSTMFLRRLVMFLHFDTYMLEYPQKEVSCLNEVYQLSFFPHIELLKEYHIEKSFGAHALFWRAQAEYHTIEGRDR